MITAEQICIKMGKRYPDCQEALWEAKNDPELMKLVAHWYYVTVEENAIREVLGANKTVLRKKANMLSVLLLVLQLLLSAFLCYCLYWPILLVVLPITALAIFGHSYIWSTYDKAIRRLINLACNWKNYSVAKEMFEKKEMFENAVE